MESWNLGDRSIFGIMDWINGLAIMDQRSWIKKIISIKLSKKTISFFSQKISHFLDL